MTKLGRTTIVLAACLLTLVLSAPALADETTRVGFPRFPALSPDGRTVVFSWAGDLWAADATGGKATRLTAHAAYDSSAVFSPDGTLLAFESDRDGQRNLYVAPIDGAGSTARVGRARRVTVSDRPQSLSGFDPDGSGLLFSARMSPSIYRHARMYRAPLDGGPVTRITDAFGMTPRFSPDGRELVFTRGYTIHDRPIYRGSGSLSIFAMDTESETFRRVTTFDGNDFEPFHLPDRDIVFISSRDGQNNLYRLTAGRDDAGGRLRQLTAFAPSADEVSIGHGVRELNVSADGSTAAFIVWDTLYTLDLKAEGAEPEAIELHASADTDVLETERITLNQRVTEAALSPDGKTLAVIARGEVFVRSTEEGRPTRRVTRSHARARDLTWSPDGRALYFAADADDSLANIYEATVALTRDDLTRDEPPPAPPAEPAEDNDAGETQPDEHPDNDEPADDADEPDTGADAEREERKEKVDHGARWAASITFDVRPIVEGPNAQHAPVPSPDGRRLLYVRGLGDVILRDLLTDEERVVFESWDQPEIVWASDSRHIVYAINDLDFNSDIWILDLDAEPGDALADPVNITRHPDGDYNPRLSHDGKVLVFRSDRDGRQYDVYAVYLDKALEGMPDYELDDYFKSAASAARRLKPVDTPEPDDEPAERESLRFDVDDAFLRVRSLVSLPESQGNLHVTPGGDRVIFSGRADGSTALFSVDHRGRDRKTLQSGGVSDVTVSLDGGRVLFVQGGQARSTAPGGGTTTTHGIEARVVIDVREQQRQKFREAAGIFGARFYHPTMKGLDWDALTRRYESLAVAAPNANDFNRVVSMLFGEVDASHTGISGGDAYSAPSPGNGYLGIDAEPVENGYRVTRVVPGGPADRRVSRLREGDVILAVDGEPLADDRTEAGVRDLHAALAGTAGNETLLEIRRAGDADESGHDRRFVLITPWSFGAENNLRYTDEVLQRRDMVEELSEGRLGYLHIRGMNEPSVRDFVRDLFAAADGRDGLLIDVRDNGGGWTTDILLASLTAPAHAYTVPRGVDPDAVPPDTYPRVRRLIYGYTRPINVLMNQHSFSNAEIFSHAIRTIERGRLVGTATFGGVISTGAFTLIDGARVRMPFRGWYLPDGTDMENNGAKPHVPVAQTPADETAGRDPQLEAAVRDLLERIDAR